MLYRGLLASAYSGKLNGLVASHCHGSQYFRAHAIPTNPNTTRQQQLRDALAQETAHWQDLDQEFRDGWEIYAKQHRRPNALGDTANRTGFNEFIRWAVPRAFANNVFGSALGIGDAVARLPEAALNYQPLASIESGGTVFRLELNALDFWVNDQDNVVLLWLSAARGGAQPPVIRSLPPTINYFRGPWVLAGMRTGDPDDPIDPNLDVTIGHTVASGHSIRWKCHLSTDDTGYSTEYSGVAFRP